MTPEQIEEALEQPEFNKPLMDLAKKRIAVDTALEEWADVVGGERYDHEDFEADMDTLDDKEHEFFEDFAGPFEVTTGCQATATDIIKTYYQGIKTRLLKPENRIKKAMNNG